MLFCKDVTSPLDVIDDAAILADRLKILEHLLFKCVIELPAKGCHFQDDTRDGYDGSQMLDLLDESLTNLINEYEQQVAKYDAVFLKNKPAATTSMKPAKRLAASKDRQPRQAA